VVGGDHLSGSAGLDARVMRVDLASAVKMRLSRDASAQAGQGPEGFSSPDEEKVWHWWTCNCRQNEALRKRLSPDGTRP
jgi:hypothetical protein